MTPQEALNVLSNTNFSVNNEAEEQKCRVYQAAFKTAIEALEKQIPKKPDVVGEEYIFEIDEWQKDYECSTCGNPYIGDSFCSCCGQKLDWK